MNAEDLLKEEKLSLRIDGDDDDNLIKSYLKAADGFVKNAVGDEIDGFWEDGRVENLLKIATMALAGAYYDYRTSLTDVKTFPINLTVNSIIGSLRGIYASWLYDKQLTGDDTNV